MHLVRLAAVVVAGLSKAPLQGIQGSHDAQQLVAQTGMVPFYLQAESATVLTLLCDSMKDTVIAVALHGLTSHGLFHNPASVTGQVADAGSCALMIAYTLRQEQQMGTYRLHPVFLQSVFVTLQCAGHIYCTCKPLTMLLERIILHYQKASRLWVTISRYHDDSHVFTSLGSS